MDPISGNRLCYGHHFLSGMYGRLFQEDWGCSSTFLWRKKTNGRYMGMSYSHVRNFTMVIP